MKNSEDFSLSPHQVKLLEDITNKLRKNKGNTIKKKQANSIPTPFSVKDLMKLFNSIDDAKNSVICFLAVRFGMRRKEILTLRVEDIDFRLKRIILDGTAKGGKSAVFHLDEPTIRILRKYILLLGYEKGDMFPSYYINGSTTLEGFSNNFKKVLQRAGLSIVNTKKIAHRKRHVLTFHNLRTTFISLLVNQSLSPFIVKELARHSKLETTMRYYTYLGSPTIKKASEKVFGQGKKLYSQEKDGSRFIVDREMLEKNKNRSPLEINQLNYANGLIDSGEFMKRDKLLKESFN